MTSTHCAAALARPARQRQHPRRGRRRGLGLFVVVTLMAVLTASPVAAQPSAPSAPSVERGVAGVEGEIDRLYLALLDRHPEEAGLEYWVDRRIDGMALTEMVAFFRTSPEFQQTFGSQLNATTAEWVDFMYVEVLERPSEPEGKAFWVDQVESGQATKEDLIVFFADSVEFRVKTHTGMEGLMALVDESEALYATSSNHRYERSFLSIVGGSTTTITVANGVVVERAYEQSTVQNNGVFVDDAWVETGDDIGTHDQGAEPLTVPEVHDACRAFLVTLDEDPLYRLVVETDETGRMIRCGGDFLEYIADSAGGDYITIENYEITGS